LSNEVLDGRGRWKLMISVSAKVNGRRRRAPSRDIALMLVSVGVRMDL
jgi:hypothetical protein